VDADLHGCVSLRCSGSRGRPRRPARR
jgi:hypothetical protein